MKKIIFSELNFIGHKKIQIVKPRSAIIAFNLIGLYEIAEQIRSLKGGVALVAGALSPKTRNSQVKLYEDGEVGSPIVSFYHRGNKITSCQNQWILG